MLMKKKHVSKIIILLVICLLAFGCRQEFTKVTAPFTVDPESEGFRIPQGSVIYHWANGITEVYGPDNTRILIAKDAEAAQIPAPGGPAPATHVYYVPSGTSGGPDESGKINKNYLDDALILTIIEKDENYPVD